MSLFYTESRYPFDRLKAEIALCQFLADNSLGQCWLLGVAAQAVGYVAVSFTFSLEYFGPTVFVEDLYIKPDYRGSGLGRLSLQTAESAYRDLGILALHLEVERKNEAAG